MELVVNANILFSFFNRESFTRSLIVNASRYGLKLYTPDFCIDELERDKNRVLKYSKLDDSGFALALSAIDSFITLVLKPEYAKYLSEARKLLPKHPKDIPYLALALAFNIPLWSNEKRLKEQADVEVLNTQDLLERLRLI
jgi:predicted nucleic acid-binding protein